VSIYFLDTEFVEDGETIMPISLGLVPLNRNRRELYLEFDFDDAKAEAHDFVRDNVLPHLRGQERYTREEAARAIAAYLGVPAQTAESKEHIEFWAYYADYDWVVFCQIFGTMMDLPRGLPHLCFDLQQLYLLHARPAGCAKPPPPANAHDALADAEWNRDFYEAMVGSRG
jgi:hypothetical protein